MRYEVVEEFHRHSPEDLEKLVAIDRRRGRRNVIGFKWRGRTHTVLTSVEGKGKKHPVEALFPLFKDLASMAKKRIKGRLK